MATTTAAPAAATETRSTTSEWLRIARGGAIVMVFWSMALQGFAQSVIPPVAMIGLVFAGFAPFLRGERRVLGLVVALFGTLAVLGNLEIILDDLRNPESAPAFILNLLSLVGVSLAVIGGLLGFLRRPAQPIRTLVIVAAGVFIAGSAASAAIAANTPTDAALPGDVKVTAHRLMWAPATIDLDASATGLWVENQDGIRHTFTIPQLGIDIEVPALKARRVDIDAVAGEYQIICTVPGHETMTAALMIEGRGGRS